MTNPIMAYRKHDPTAEALMKCMPNRDGAVRKSIRKTMVKQPAHHFKPLNNLNPNRFMVCPCCGINFMDSIVPPYL
jgi:hypothetical protein